MFKKEKKKTFLPTASKKKKYKRHSLYLKNIRMLPLEKLNDLLFPKNIWHFSTSHTNRTKSYRWRLEQENPLLIRSFFLIFCSIATQMIKYKCVVNYTKTSHMQDH
jgi:hypothetical protein